MGSLLCTKISNWQMYNNDKYSEHFYFLMLFVSLLLAVAATALVVVKHAILSARLLQ